MVNNSFISFAFLSASSLTLLLTESINESSDLNAALLNVLSMAGSKLNKLELESFFLATAVVESNSYIDHRDLFSS